MAQTTLKFTKEKNHNEFVDCSCTQIYILTLALHSGYFCGMNTGALTLFFSHFKKVLRVVSWEHLVCVIHVLIRWTHTTLLLLISLLVWWIILIFCLYFKARITSKNQTQSTNMHYMQEMHSVPAYSSQIKLYK